MTQYSRLVRLVLAPTLDLLKKRHTMRCLRELEESQWWPLDRIQQLQSERLQRLIHYTYAHVPYYRRLIDGCGLSPGCIRTSEDLSLLPVLTKAEVREHIGELIADGFPRGELLEGCTGGSTGEPLVFYSSRESQSSRGIARTLRALEWAGAYPGDPTVTVTRRRYRDSFWPAQFRRVVRLLLRESFEDCASLSDSSLPFVVQRIARLHPHLLTGYPSALCIIAEYIRDSEIPSPEVNTIVVGGEALFDEQRSLLRDVFGSEPFSEYSSYENFDIAMECDAHAGLHVAAEDLIVEVVDESGRPVKPGRQGRVVITNLHEYGMPLIRYDTDDESSLVTGMCECGRSLPRLSPVFGKAGHSIYTPSGKRLSARSFVARDLVSLGIRRFQLVQDKLDHVTVRVVPNASLSSSSALEMVAAVKAHYSSTLGDDVEIQVDIVDRIEPTQAGKHLFVISKVKRPAGRDIS
ncbi:MAG: phenylacetate--CoA ligase family protein [Dehalococcoidia bacterium]|nr:phenylacetate--CoA ligase family protein [Dehalococcoidia bacterium]